MDRELLLPRLEERVQGMWQKGLVQEVESLIPKGLRDSKTASVAIGYAQALGFIDGELTRDEAVASTVQLTQRYARRQVSWFKRDDRINWLEALAPDIVEQAFEKVVAEGFLDLKS
jgi:tRNA dimethylallyltransferase